MRFAPPKGTRDFYPEEMRIRTWIFSTWRTCALAYGFEEYDGPIIEDEALYTLKSGEEILSQLYTFTDKGGRRIALRPEMTPTMARMIAAEGSKLARPIKWFAIAQCFRYERMSLGRKREHYQWNLDIVGTREVTAEAEVIAVALEALGRLGIPGEEVVVRINHKGIIEALFDSLEIPGEKRAPLSGIIDKHGKEPESALREMCAALDIPAAAVEEIFSLFRLSGLDSARRLAARTPAGVSAVDELERLFGFLGDYGVAGCCRFVPSVVRGLPYYTGIVFECFDRQGRFRAIFGGGRYDRLLELFGAKESPAVGLGFGDVVVREMLEARGALPHFKKELDFFIIPYSEAERATAIGLAQRLRRQGHRVDMTLEIRKLKRALTDAARSGARHALMLLPEELKERSVRMRSLATGEEQTVSIDAVCSSGETTPLG